MNFKKMMQKAVNTKTKAGLRSSIMVWNLDVRCPRGHRLSHNIFLKMQIQGFKDFSCSKKPKPKDSKPVLLCDNAAKPAKIKDQKDKKKRFRNQKREHTEEQIMATGVNTNTSKKKIKARCFNNNKKSYYANKCTKLPKKKSQSWQPLCQWLIIEARRLCSKGYLVSIIRFDSRKAKNR